MKEYKRILDCTEPTMDSLEQILNSIANENWEVVCIDYYGNRRAATLVREIAVETPMVTPIKIKPEKKKV